MPLSTASTPSNTNVTSLAEFIGRQDSMQNPAAPNSVVNEPPTVGTAWFYRQHPHQNSIKLNRDRLERNYSTEERQLLSALRTVLREGQGWAAGNSVAADSHPCLVPDGKQKAEPAVLALTRRTHGHEALYEAHRPVFAELVRETAPIRASRQFGTPVAGPSGT